MAEGDDREVLLQRRSDLGSWNPICGTVEPGEDPDLCCIREVFEETGVTVELERLLSTAALPPTTLPNGHTVQYLDLSFSARPTPDSGPAVVADDESLRVEWRRLDDLLAMPERHLVAIARALDAEGPVRFGREGRTLLGLTDRID